MDSKLPPKNAKLFSCDLCDFNCFKLCDWTRHVLRPKHIKRQIDDKKVIICETKTPTNADCNICKCGKIYKNYSSLWRHNKICNQNINNTIIETTNDELIQEKNELIQYLINENKEFKSLILEIVKKDNISNINNNISNINTNSHNKSFNLNFFLNETCKDAMNIMEFVDSLKLQLSDLENVGKLGFVEGISKIIVSNLNLLDETKRPVHCTDSKREIMYVKDEDKWEKENENKQKMRKVIKHVAHKNTKLLKDYKTKYQGCEKSESKYSDKYDKLIIEAFGGKGDNDDEKENKIIRNIAKEVTIDK